MRFRLLCLLGTALPLLSQSNPELARIYEADQKDRAGWFTLTQTQQQEVGKRDAVRRQRVGEMVRGGLLKTGEDFERASFVFQHGETLNDFALAHALAMTASAVEPFRGTWIAAATFERYLARSGKAAIFGTPLDHKTRFDQQLLSDSIRELNCVPSLAVREQQIREITGKRQMTTPGPCNARPEILMGKWALTLRKPDGTFSQAMLDFSGSAQNLEVAYTEDGRSSDPDQLTLGDRRLSFRVGERAFEIAINGDAMSGTFTSVNGAAGRLVGLVSRPR